jgi:DNA-binding Lrp family transcriptional regulator
MNQVDALDEQILAALQASGRLTMKALAEQVGLSARR